MNRRTGETPVPLFSIVASYNASYSATTVASENSSTTLLRAARPRPSRPVGPNSNNSSQPAASAFASRVGTTRPVLLSIHAESPTSVTTQGTADDIASPTITGKLSP